MFTRFDDLKETALVTLEEMEREAREANDYDLQAELRSLIQLLVRVWPPRARYPNT